MVAQVGWKFFVYSLVTQLLEKNMHDRPIQQKLLDCSSSENSSAESEGKCLTPPAFQLMASTGEDGPPVQRKESSGGLPGDLVSGFAASTGHDLSNVNVHRNSEKPSQVGALAYAQGNDIHLGAGQDQHLAHEAAHIVQQREGRVQANTSVGGMPVNDSKSLESEADNMGAKALQMKTATDTPSQMKTLSGSGVSQRQVIQKKDVPTNFGTFKTPRLEKFDETGVKCWLDFEPDEKRVDATKIGLVQAVKGTYKDGTHTGLDPASENRRVKSGPGQDYHIDREDGNNPVYGTLDLQNGEGLDKTRKDTNYNQEPTKVGPDEEGGNSTYELGYAYSDKSGKKKKTAKMYDRPNGGAGMTFETTALALEGKQKNEYYGSVKWGFEVRDGKVVPQDIELVSMGDPSANFVEAAKLWNKSKTRGTLEVIANPAKALRYGSLAPTDLPKGSKLQQNSLGLVNDKPMPVMELLDASGTGTGKLYYVHVNDLKDMGNGKETVDLPVRKSNWWGETDLDGTVELPPAKEKHWWGDE